MTWSQERLINNFFGLFNTKYADLIFYLSSAGSMLLYLGLLCLPLMLALYIEGGDKKHPGATPVKFWITTGILLSIVTAVLLANSILMPVRGNLLTGTGIGPFTLRDVYALNLPHLFTQLITVFLNFFAIMNPIANTATFAGLIGDKNKTEQVKIASRALIITFL